ncbi:MAG: 2,3,4,5-tetrahydropyridine-2,6-dicarboxylate N-acetyltransferase [Candidatus Muirbacterium halophilum]|nr:2,3,4,5-tetrahydropyridine-2,6-dicarboxylate N-acetyltransferase [Candidatus Muirbacterium halophilum]MCK9474468.1 2,3,4,5-tetrahydropyridine-2,6-dicarboxylate N-acetyltransferase [Candidatus Muirbacterium halophilum]
MDYKEITALIKNSVRKTPSKFYIKSKGKINFKPSDKYNIYGENPFYLIIGDYNSIKDELDYNKNLILHFDYEVEARNSALPLFKKEYANSRIEPGAIIRDKVEIGKSCIIMMGSVINIGAVISDGTMIDMNAVIGARGIIGKNCHIGAGAVVAGVLEPPSATPVIIEDNVVVGANAVILEGVNIGQNSVIGACSVVTQNIPANSVAVGCPAKVIKTKDKRTDDKTKIVEDLR